MGSSKVVDAGIVGYYMRAERIAGYSNKAISPHFITPDYLVWGATGIRL